METIECSNRACISGREWKGDFEDFSKCPTCKGRGYLLKNIKPVVGMDCTYNCGSDRYPFVITSITASGKTIMARNKHRSWSEDKKFMLRDGKYLEKGGDVRFSLTLGVADSHLDPHF